MVAPIKKKSIAYLIMSLTILGIIVANMAVVANRFKKIESSNIEVVNNEFVGTVISEMADAGIDRFMSVASKKALQHLASYKAAGNDIDDINSAFDSLVLNGTLNNTLQYRYPTLVEFLGAVTNYYFVLGFSIDKISINSTLSQNGPWNIVVSSKIRYKVNAPRAMFSGIINEEKETVVGIFGIDDPSEGWKITTGWSQNSTYPGFMDRLEGNAGGSEYGICRIC